MQVAPTWVASVVLTAAAAVAVGVIGWILNRRLYVRWTMITASLGLMVAYDIFSISSYLIFDQTVIFLLVMTTLEEATKFSACKLTNLSNPGVRFLIGCLFGLLEIILSKNLVIIFSHVGWNEIEIFIYFCIVTVLMHGIVTLYYTISRFYLLGILIATGIHLINNIISLAAAGNSVWVVAAEQLSILIISFSVYRFLLRSRAA